jgi:hypothetical protein
LDRFVAQAKGRHARDLRLARAALTGAEADLGAELVAAREQSKRDVDKNIETTSSRSSAKRPHTRSTRLNRSPS